MEGVLDSLYSHFKSCDKVANSSDNTHPFMPQFHVLALVMLICSTETRMRYFRKNLVALDLSVCGGVAFHNLSTRRFSVSRNL